MGKTISKHFMQKVLQETIQEFSKKVIPVDIPVELAFIEQGEFMESVKNDPLIKMQIQAGLYQDIDKEYPNFLVVYAKDKHPMLRMFGMTFKISVCFDIASKRLKPFNALEIREYLKHGFAHEIGHLLENEIKSARPDLWSQALAESANNEKLANEWLSETVAHMIGDSKKHKDIEERLWASVLKRAALVRGKVRG